ncbi:carboxylesterase/lipase family protein [Lapillicoccus jejuensis]|uniref:Carboxylic ester hydrolase n=1 Tax=Lapillicoccus jejuensis TaxID=402171 RepID=A0A542E0K7_9MICO|nr:carboxylesterase family protein [Lapillicoccus jejuensis]TQJ08878.1 para-nitrobenzyl esterase [Lapillicoccus jejuensis]
MSRRRWWTRAVPALTLLVAGGLVTPALAAPAQAAPGAPPVVRTGQGTLQGALVDGVDDFLGVPYAAPPTGARRWQPPAPAPTWSGSREATSYGPRCAALASSNGARSDSEDCLYLNVYRPHGATASSALPVYLFIHGGGLVNGSSNQAGGEQFARETGAVVVSINYRLGVFGFLGLAGLSSRGEGNYGFLDQQAALRWVQREIGAFGGDSGRVTVGGESAGGFSVCGHLVAQSSRGLFARAMMQSGGCPSRPVAATEKDSRTFAATAGCTTDRVACLRTASAAALLDASTGFSPTLTTGVAPFPVPLVTAVERGDVARVPMVVGSNRDEGRTFFTNLIGGSRADYVAFVRGLYGASADAVLARYPWPARSDRFTAAYLASDVATDSGILAGIGGCGTLATASAFDRVNPVWMYEFDARRGPGLTPIPGYVWGAGHAAELAYLFPSFDNGTPIAPTFDSGERQLSRDMTAYWGAFVTTGTPQATNRALWPGLADGSVLSLRPGGRSTAIGVDAYRAEHRCDFWASLGRA